MFYRLNRLHQIVWVAAMSIAASGLTAPATAQTATADLRPRFIPDQVTRYRIWSLRRQTQSVTIGDRRRDFDTRFEIEAQLTWTVARVHTDGSATCSMTIDWMTAAWTGPDGQTQHSDSRRTHGQPEAIHGLLAATTGVPITLKVSQDGSISSASGIDPIRRRVPSQANVPDELDFIEAASDLATIANATPAVPIGGHWDARFTWNHQLGKIHQSMRYTLESIEDIEQIPVATVTGTARLRLEPDVDRLRQAAADAGSRVQTRLIAGGVQTQILFDLQRHQAVGRNTVEDRHIEIDIRWPQQTISRTIQEQIHSQVLRVGEH